MPYSDDLVDLESIVATPAGDLIAFGADAGREVMIKGEHALDTTVFRPNDRIVRRIANSVPMGFVDARTLVLRTRIPFTMEPDVPVYRVVDAPIGRHLAEFPATTVAIQTGWSSPSS